MADDKTNVMRILDQMKIPYTPHSYQSQGALSGVEVARVLGFGAERIFKTLVTVGKTGAHYVFVIPSDRELDLKKAARAAAEKSIEMIKSKDLLPLTGYVHGGCSPVGMKKRLRTFVDESAAAQPTLLVSAGKIGHQVEFGPDALEKAVSCTLCDLCGEKDEAL